MKGVAVAVCGGLKQAFGGYCRRLESKELMWTEWVCIDAAKLCVGIHWLHLQQSLLLWPCSAACQSAAH